MPLRTLPPSRILVVANHEDSAKELVTQLRRAGHEVEVAHDGPSTLQVERAFRPDIVIIDLGLPGMDACSVARLLRARTNRDVMLVADGGSEEDHDRAHQAGCFNDHVARFHGRPLLPSLGMKLAEQSVEDWVSLERCHAASKDHFVLGMLAAAAGRFDPAELAPLLSDEVLREMRRLAESPTELEDCLGGLKDTFISDERRDGLCKGTSRWLGFFNP